MNSSKITNKVIKKFPYMNAGFITRIRTPNGWGVFIPSANEGEQEEIMALFGNPRQDHDLVGIVIPLSSDESAQLDEAQKSFAAEDDKVLLWGDGASDLNSKLVA